MVYDTTAWPQEPQHLKHHHEPVVSTIRHQPVVSTVHHQPVVSTIRHQPVVSTIHHQPVSAIPASPLVHPPVPSATILPPDVW